jgi:hypothetical protein
MNETHTQLHKHHSLWPAHGFLGVNANSENPKYFKGSYFLKFK